MPAGHMQSADSGLPPTLSEVIQIYARTVGAVEKRPQPLAAKRGLDADVAERLQQIRETLVTRFAGRCGNPERRSGASANRRHHGRALPAFGGEDYRLLWQLKHRDLESSLPDDRELRRTAIYDTPNYHALRARLNAKRFGQLAFAFDHDHGPLLDPLDPLRGGAGRSV